MKVLTAGALITAAVAVTAFAPKAHAETPAGAYSMSGQVNAVYRLGAAQSGTVQVIRTDFGGALPVDAAAAGVAEAKLREAGAAAVRVALAAGAVEGRADSIAVVYRLGGADAQGAPSPFAPVAVLHCETKFSLDAAGAAHVAQAFRVAPIDASEPARSAPPQLFAPRSPERLPETSPDYVPQPLPER
ncbi:MAG: hypothetical protein KJS97_00300 [Alphaproteobacteria bacterium]|nr:hypothetical protein [Alphaproteobacteria bacterium]